MIKRAIATVALAVVLGSLAGCGQVEEGAGGAGADSITQRQRDSVVSESGLPGAKGVGRALDASDAAAARAAAMDSVAGGR